MFKNEDKGQKLLEDVKGAVQNVGIGKIPPNELDLIEVLVDEEDLNVDFGKLFDYGFDVGITLVGHVGNRGNPGLVVLRVRVTSRPQLVAVAVGLEGHVHSDGVGSIPSKVGAKFAFLSVFLKIIKHY